MRQIFVTLLIIALYACSSESPLLIEELQVKNGIYRYKNQHYTGKAYSYFPKTTIPMRTIECSLNEENTLQICIINEFSKDGTRITGSTHNGSKEGSWYIYKNNRLKEHITYKNNKREGISYYYRQNSLYEEKEYMENMLHGLFLVYYTEQELQDSTTTQDDNNVISKKREKEIKTPQSFPIKERGEYRYNKKEGLWYTYYPDGTLYARIEYLNDMQHGIYTSYYIGGTIQEEGEYVHGAKHGTWLTFYDTGQIHHKRHYIHGIQEGTEINYHKNSKIEDEIPYHNGLIKGTVHSYDESGKLERTTFYDIIDE